MVAGFSMLVKRRSWLVTRDPKTEDRGRRIRGIFNPSVGLRTGIEQRIPNGEGFSGSFLPLGGDDAMGI